MTEETPTFTKTTEEMLIELEAKTLRLNKAIVEKEEQDAGDRFAGVTDAVWTPPPEPKEETNTEYKDRILKGDKE